MITEIREPGSEDDDVEALKARISELEAENEALKSNAKSDDDVKVLNAVKKAGGIDRLTKAAASKYVPAGRQATSKRVEVTKPMSKIERKLQKIREQRNKE